MSDQYVGEVRMVAFTYAPAGWALCQGQTMSIAQNQALFALIGTIYGGDGIQTFKLPDLAGRSPVGTGAGAGLSTIALGEVGGVEQTTILTTQMPMHTHVAVLPATTAAASVAVPASTATTGGQVSPATTTVLGEVTASGRTATMYNTTAPDTTLAPFNVNVPIPQTNVTVNVTGGSLPVQLRNPYIGLNFCIALQGVYPARP